MKSLLAWLNSNEALPPLNFAINAVLADIEAVWRISKPWLVGDPLLGGASQSLG